MTEAPQGKLNRRKFLLGLAGLTILPLSQTPANAYQPFESFSFAYITDVHLANDQPDSYEMVHESQLFLQELVRELNAEKLDFVMFGGDQVQTVGTDENNWQLFLDCVQGLSAPWSFVLGDKDISGNMPVDKMRTFGPDWKLRGIETDTPYWSHNPSSTPNIHLVGLDTSMPNTTVGGVSTRQLDWLKQDLASNRKFFTMVFCHHPLLPPPPYDGGPPWDDYVIPDGGAVREVLGSFPNVKVVVSGHVHISKVQNEKDIWHISSPSLVVYPCAYRIFRVTPEAVTMETRQIEFPALVKKAKKELINSAMAERYNRGDPGSFIDVVEGAREDRNAIIPMRAGQPIEPYNPKRVRKPKAEPEHTESPPEHEHKGPFRKHAKSKPEQTAPVKSKTGKQTKPAEQKELPTQKAPTESKPPAKTEPPPAPEPSKPDVSEPVKDINSELDKQLNMQPQNSDGANK